MSYKEGDWFIYCDICGQRSYASESTKLSTYTGKGGLIVCNHDVDRIDYGLLPYRTRKEQSVSFVRPNHTNTTDGTVMVDLESMTIPYFLAASQDNVMLLASQDDALLTVNVPL